jgi:hypothetical protein
MIGTVASLVGNPAVTNVMKAALPYVDGKISVNKPVIRDGLQDSTQPAYFCFSFFKYSFDAVSHC